MDVDRTRIEGHRFLAEMRRDCRRRDGRTSRRVMPWVAGGIVVGMLLLAFGSPWALPVFLSAVALGNLAAPDRQSRVGLVMEAASHVTAVSCPACHAPVGARCVLPAFDVRVCHEERGRAYNRAVGSGMGENGKAGECAP